MALSEVAAAQTAALTEAYRRKQKADARKIALAVGLYYSRRVNTENPGSIERWLELIIPKIISTSDLGARQAAAFYDSVRRVEGVAGDGFTATPALGVVDPGVRKSLLTVGPYAYENKALKIGALDIPDARKQLLLREAKQETVTKVVGATLRHGQAGSRDTIYRNAEADEVALGYVRVTDGDPCYFCALLASRGLRYRAFKEDSFELSDQRFTGDGDAKVHDHCGCGLKAVYTADDPLVRQTDAFADMYSRWGAGGGSDAVLRFRRGYEHFQATGEYLDYDQVASAA